MVCLKCGRESQGMFCDECQEQMQKYPVKPGTVVQILNREQLLPPKKKVKPQATPEERIAGLRKTVARLHWINALLAAMFLISCMLIFNLYNRSTPPQRGQNYSTIPRPTTAQQDPTGE